MTYLCINNLDNVSLYNISVKDNIIYYDFHNLTMYGLLFQCSGELVEKENKYKLFIHNQKIKSIDEYLTHKIENYNSFLFSENNKFYIEIKKNNIITNLLKKYKQKDNFYLNIKYINKYNNTPIVYLI